MATEKRRRNTPQRTIIHEELRALTTHPTAAELFDKVRRRLPRISLGTVYRNLEVLHSDGHILKLEMAGAEARFDGNVHSHCHIRCTECGIVRDIDMERPIDPVAEIGDPRGFKVEGFKLKFLGLCPSCQESPSGCEPGHNPIN
jgi:Fur family transcriptional regulator, peroxide stress response regulator